MQILLMRLAIAIIVRIGESPNAKISRGIHEQHPSISRYPERSNFFLTAIFETDPVFVSASLIMIPNVSSGLNIQRL